MGEFVVGAIMIRTPIAVRSDTVFKDVVCALLAGEVCAVPVVDADGRPRGTIAEGDVLANLEFHGGLDPAPILGGPSARKRWRKAAAATAAELMSGPAVMVCADERISQAAKRLAQSAQPMLCVVDPSTRLIGVLTARDLLTAYQRSDDSIETEINAVLAADLAPTTPPTAVVTLHVNHGIVVLDGTLLFRSRVEHASYAASRVTGVVAVHNHLTYELDDLAITGF